MCFISQRNVFTNMVTLEECSCTDTTEPSNLTSLRSDDVTVNSDVNALFETVEKENDVVEGSKGMRVPAIYVTS